MILATMEVGAAIGIAVACLIAGLAAGFFGARALFKKQLRDNPPITEKQIRVMLTQMGRKPSEKQVREIMKSMNSGR